MGKAAHLPNSIAAGSTRRLRCTLEITAEKELLNDHIKEALQPQSFARLYYCLETDFSLFAVTRRP